MPGRVVIYSTALPAAIGLDALARACGLEPVALITPRRDATEGGRRFEQYRALVEQAPAGLDLCLVRDRSHLEAVTRAYEPDLGLCTGYPWQLPPGVLAVPRLGVVNGHPSMLPRHRGPYPLAWAIREGDAELGLTYHLMDAELDTGPVLAQGSRPLPADTGLESLTPLFVGLSSELLPRALERLLAGDRGDPQHDEGATWAGPFEEAYRELDWSASRVAIDRQVRAWRWHFAAGPGPLATIDGERVVVLRTSLVDPGGEGRRVEAGDGPLWVLETEPADGSAS